MTRLSQCHETTMSHYLHNTRMLSKVPSIATVRCDRRCHSVQLFTLLTRPGSMTMYDVNCFLNSSMQGSSRHVEARLASNAAGSTTKPPEHAPSKLERRAKLLQWTAPSLRRAARSDAVKIPWAQSCFQVSGSCSHRRAGVGNMPRPNLELPNSNQTTQVGKDWHHMPVYQS